MNTPLTVERLNTLRAQLIAHSQREANLIDPDLCGTGVELIDAHLSPSAELGKAGEIVPWQVLGMIDNTRADLDRVTENLRQASTALYRHVDPKTEAPPPPPADVQAVERIAGQLGQLRDFLNGEASYGGYYFGEKHSQLKGAFWWRTVMRATIDRAITFLQQRPFSEELREAMLAASVTEKEFADSWRDCIKRNAPMDKAWHEIMEAKIALHDRRAALLTRAAEGKEKP
jgi:hypothetical protein